jgi:hypothetical protein
MFYKINIDSNSFFTFSSVDRLTKFGRQTGGENAIFEGTFEATRI